MSKWEYMELKITHNEIEVVEDEFRSSKDPKRDPYEYVQRMIDDGWEVITRSGSLEGEFSVVLKRPISE